MCYHTPRYLINQKEMEKTKKPKSHITLIAKILYINRILSYFVFAGAFIFAIAITLFLTPVPYSETPALDLAIQALATSVPALLLGYCYVVVSDSLYTVIRNVEKRNPFDKQSQKKVRKMGTVTLALAIFLAIFRYIVAPLAVDIYFDSSFPAYQLNPFLLLGFSLIMFALAEVFAQGEKLKEDQELTV